MEVGTFECRRQDCAKVPNQNCAKCGMPEVTARTSWLLNLRNRCKAYRCLPYSGGLLEQPVWLMDLFDAIDAEYAAWQREQDEEARRRRVQAEQEQELRRRTGT